MVAPNWTDLKDVTILAKPPHGYWILAVDYVDHATRLRFEVASASSSTWKYGDRVCTADGDESIPLARDKSLVEAAPPAALVAKIGGSRGGKRDGLASFVVGSYCVYELVDKQRGPLYLAMNIEPGFSLEPSGLLVVKISGSA